MSVLFKALSRSADANRSAKVDNGSLLQPRPAAAGNGRGTGGRPGRGSGRRPFRYLLLGSLVLFCLLLGGLALLPQLWVPLLLPEERFPPLVVAERPPPPATPAAQAPQPALRPPPGAEGEGGEAPAPPPPPAAAEAGPTEAPAAAASTADTEAAPAEETAAAVEEPATTPATEVAAADPFEPPPLNLPPPPGGGGALRDLVPLQELAQRVLGGGETSARAERVPPAWSGGSGPWETEARGQRPAASAGSAPSPRRGLVIEAGPPPSPRERDLRAAQQAMAQGAFEAAVPLYEQALRSSPNDGQAEIGLAVALQKLGRDDEALAVYNRLLLREPGNVAALTNFFGLVGSRSPTLAIEEMRRLLQRNPDQPAIVAQLGLVHAQAGDRNGALRYLEEAVRLAPEDAVFVMNLAVLNDQLGRREEAIRHYQRVLRLAEAQSPADIPVASVRDRLRYLHGH